ncbi:MAG: lamin tail domain-containing protein [Sandaracinus sp.]|nr:lamin tail domain-containing protein [Sandaracinus sp.]
MAKRFLGLALVLALACGDDDGPPMEDGGVVSDGGDRDGGTPERDGGSDAGTCVDGDDDGYGEGCALGPDCDDGDPNASPSGTEICDGADNDCNGTVDDGLTGPSCGLTDGVCAGATARCGGEGGFLTCDTADYGADYEATETLCDGLDNDCDGTTDEGCPCEDGATQACGSDEGVCMAGTQTCTSGTFGACVGEVGPMGESCNGLDDDCDGMMDEPGDLTPPACPLQQGVCAGSVRACGGVAGWIACSGVASYGGDYQATETLCDGLDNDCDGIVDEGCTCIDGATQACGSDVGLCMAGTQTCTAGAWGGCAGEVAPASETCNGSDDDCDGSVDDGLTGPACALQEGVCAGSRQRCSGAGGFVACTATEYGARYQATESMCDGFDNDCDGMIDEGCECVTGATQACGSSVGACERGTQTCVAGSWGACTGGVTPQPETCNGADDDCNGVTDDALVAPACALTEGVCTDAVQTCGGAAGWIACAGTDSYGPSFLAAEDGAANEGHCDGLDNDCDGTVDDGCTTGPVLSGDNDLVSPSMHGQHIVYLENFDGNWDVAFGNLTTGEVRRLTTTAANEAAPRIRGNDVVFLRGDDTARRAVHVDLVTGVERVISTQQTSRAEIDGGTIVFDQYDGSQWDIFVYDIATAMASPLFSEPSLENELEPVLRGSRLAFVSFDGSSRLVTFVIDFAATPPSVSVQTPGGSSVHGQRLPVLDHGSVGWTDGRAIAEAMPTEMSNWDAYGASFGVLPTVFPAEAAFSTAVGAQLLNDSDGLLAVWTDLSRSNGDVAIGRLGGTPSFLTSSSATQASPAISGNVVLWTDNRRGTYDIYGAAFPVEQLPEAGFVVINEILADPPAMVDVSGDGSASTTQDEFVELVNVTIVALDVSGMTISDSTNVRHTFPAGTVIPPLGTLVVFGGGGAPAGLFGGAIVQRASSGSLGLNNDADTVTLRLGATTIDTVTYGAAANMDESVVRMSEGDDSAAMVRHSTLRAGVRFSPGTRVSGFAF